MIIVVKKISISKILSLIFTFLLVSCISNKIEVSVLKKNNPVILKLSKKYGKIFRIDIPININIKNNSIKKISYLTINYKYYPSNKGIGEDIYSLNGKDIIINNKKKNLNSFKEKKYIIYSRYQLDSSKTIQKQFKPYVEKMLTKNQDTLHIGTVADFKQKHKDLFEKLTKNDSISIQLLDNDKLGKRITVPVKWN